MFVPRLFRVGVLTASAGALLLLPADAGAQRLRASRFPPQFQSGMTASPFPQPPVRSFPWRPVGGPWGYSPYWGYGSSFGFGGGFYVPQPPPVIVVAPPKPPAEAAPDNTATLDVHVPDANADVFVDGRQTRQRGTQRTFTSPPLVPGRDYTYEIRADWWQDGQRVSSTQTATVQAGRHSSAHFFRGAPVSAGDSPKPTAPSK
jgi:uncharacterized protein (TIGR03000 family)